MFNMERIVLLAIFAVIIAGIAIAAQPFTSGYFIGNEGLVIGLGTEKGNVISFRSIYDLKVFFCIGNAEVIDAEDISFNHNKVTVKGKGACAFKLEKRS